MKKGDWDLGSISTHAPTRGATQFNIDFLHKRVNFNSRPYTRGDFLSTTLPSASMNFNSRPYTRGDLLLAFGA